MRNFTQTNATIVAANGETIRFDAFLEAAKAAIECEGKKWNCLTEEDLEDAFQNASARLWTKSVTYDPRKAQVQTWASTIARNCLRDEIKQVSTYSDRFVSTDFTAYEDEDLF